MADKADSGARSMKDRMKDWIGADEAPSGEEEGLAAARDMTFLREDFFDQDREGVPEEAVEALERAMRAMAPAREARRRRSRRQLSQIEVFAEVGEYLIEAGARLALMGAAPHWPPADDDEEADDEDERVGAVI